MNIEQVASLIRSALAPVRGRVSAMVLQMVVEASDDSTKFQTVKLRTIGDEPEEGIPHMQPGGLTHVPIPGSEGVQLSFLGQADNAVAICITNRAKRPTGLNQGETGLYSTTTNEGYTGGLKILLATDGGIEVYPSTGAQMKVNGDAQITGQLVVDGEIRGKSEVTAKYATGLDVKVTTHLTPSPFGPLGPPTPGT